MNVRKALRAVAERIGTLRTPDLLRALEWELDNLSEAFWLLAKHAQVAGRSVVLAWAAALSPPDLAAHVLEAALLPEGMQGTVTVFVSSVDGSDADSGADWTNAKVTVTGGLAAATDATFNFVYVDSAHANSVAAAITWNEATADSFVAIISVNRATGAWLAGASESISGATAAAFGIGTTNTNKNLYVYGLAVATSTSTSSLLNIGTGFVSRIVIRLVSCVLTINSTAVGTSRFMLGRSSLTNGSTVIELNNTTINIQNSTFAGAITFQTGKSTLCNVQFGYAGASKPTALFAFFGVGHVTIKDSDLSGYDTTGGNYFTVGGLNHQVLVTGCKRHATPGWKTGTFPSPEGSITAINVDSGDSHNLFEYCNRFGTITVNTSNYANNGSRFDGAGISWEIVTTADCSVQNPFVTPWIKRWVSATGSQDFHLQLIRDSATDFTDIQVRGEFSNILESSTFPQGTDTIVGNAQIFDGTPADLTNSSEVWTETLTNDNEMEIRTTRVVAEKSKAMARLLVGVASATFYLDPQLYIGSQGANPPTTWDADGADNAEPSSGSGGVTVPATNFGAEGAIIL